MKLSKEILFSMKPDQYQALSQNLLEHIRTTGEIITLQEYMRRILAGQQNELRKDR